MICSRCAEAKRKVLGSLCLVLSALAGGMGCDVAAPEPVPLPGQDVACPIDPPAGMVSYFPVEVGNEWTYRFQMESSYYDFRIQARAIAADSGAVTWTVARVDCADGGMNVRMRVDGHVRRVVQSVRPDGVQHVVLDTSLAMHGGVLADLYAHGDLHIWGYTTGTPTAPPRWYYPSGAPDTLGGLLSASYSRVTGGEEIAVVKGVGMTYYADSALADDGWARHRRAMWLLSHDVRP